MKYLKKILPILLVLIAWLTLPALAAGPAPVDLLTAGNFVVLAESGIASTGATSITGDIGVSPITSGAITGFGLTLDGSGTFSTSALVNGKVYAANYAPPTPAKMTAAVSDMMAAYTDAAGRATPDGTNLYGGNLGGQTFNPGLYKWTTGVTIPTNVTLSGGPNDVWIFQITGDLSIASATQVRLIGGAQASNVFWQVGGGAGATLGTYSTFNGNILSATQVVMQTGAVLNGRALAQTLVTLDAGTVSVPISSVSGTVFNDNGAGGGVAADGIRNGTEPGIASVTVRATSSDGSVVYDTTVTSAAGTYTLNIPALAAGSVVRIAETNPSGYGSTGGSPGTTGGAYSLVADATTFTDAADTIYTGVDFADIQLPSISGTVYNDENHNAALDGIETGTGVSGLYVKLVPTAGLSALAAAPVTGATGAYQIDGVVNGTYNLILDDNNLLTDTTPSSPTGWVGTQAPDQIIQNVVVGFSNLINKNFGLSNGSNVSGKVFKDNGAGGGTANNGIQDGTESALPGVQVAVADAGSALTYDTAVTDGSGAYTLWIPYSAGASSLKVIETNLSGYISIGGAVGFSGTYDRSTDTITFNNAPGTTYPGVNFADVPVNLLTNDNQQTMLAGSVVFYTHRFTAGTGGDVSFALTHTASPSFPDWNQVLYQDLNGNGVIDPGDPVASSPFTVTSGENIYLIVKEFVPSNAVYGGQDLITLTAQFSFTNASPALSMDYNRTDLTIVDNPTAITLIKQVDKAAALPGETITYTLQYQNLSGQPISNFNISDNTPAYTTFIGAGYGSLPASLTGCTIIQPAVGDSGTVTWQFTGTLDPGSTGTITMQVKLP